MLADELADTKIDLVLPNGYRHQDSMTALARRVKETEKFILDPQAVKMAAGVSLSKPSSVLSSLKYTKLLFDAMWVEFANADVRIAMEEFGSPNVQVPMGRVVIERSGFLLRMKEPDIISMEYVHKDRTSDGKTIVDSAPVIGSFYLGGENVLSEEERRSLYKGFVDEGVVSSISGRLASHLDLITSDPVEASAYYELVSRFKWQRNPHLSKFREGLIGSHKSEIAIEQLETAQAGEMSRLFMLQVLPALILLNCRNAVDIHHVPAPEKLNKQRAKKGRAPLMDHSLVKVHLSNTRKKVYESHGHSAHVARGGLVTGHFKVRKSGIYWWSPHWRGSKADVKPRVYNVTA